VEQSNHANYEGTIHTFTQENQVKQSKTRDLQPEGAVGGTMADSGLCYSVFRSWVHKFSEIIEEFNKRVYRYI